MRLICPNCDAQYEVPLDVVPTEGRDVQCSNCGQTWFQHHPDHMPAEPEPESETEAHVKEATIPPASDEEHVDISPSAPPSGPAPTRQELDPQVSDILRQEAELETAARVQDADPLESQPELGLPDTEDEAAKRAREARDRMARMRGEDPQPDVAAAAVGSRRDLLPDIEEINSTLRSTGDRQISGDAAAAASEPNRRKRGGFKRGFFFVVMIAVALAALYIFAPALAKTVPALDDLLAGYIGVIDQARVWLDVKVQDMLKWLDATAASQSQ
ncbi:hypothetical protein ASD8599_00952 [Ascidiaceihabitans donghaensis]|uniref:Zinc finger/thioredoxin putative domain-containing protein n=1 Tax=Ascidiaceihabitans donghaensis TaxID=1510460 RepID=A0A2R8BAX6_9RHOB|nr:zinc-ribbon domain-containing protein [Ascidiaceihabitans donghaensis]SPH20213.1 hypothetical protein ASD8599_00952 [Ascidiaceihabitans donghaensis]